MPARSMRAQVAAPSRLLISAICQSSLYLQRRSTCRDVVQGHRPRSGDDHWAIATTS